MGSSNRGTAFRTPPEALSDEQARLEPFDWYAEMRSTQPVRYDEQRRRWDVFGYDDVSEVLGDHERFTADIASADIRFTDGSPLGTTAETPSMIRTDPPEHERLRNFANHRFLPGTLAEGRERFERIADDILDTAETGTTVDIIEEFSHPFPVTVIADLLGLPAVDREQFREWSIATTELAMTDEEEAKKAQHEMSDYFSELIPDRVDGDGDDLITLAASNDELNHEEVVRFCITVLVAGNVTTVNLITSTLWCLEEHDLFDAVRAGEIDRTKLIEEVLRYRSPAQAIRRVTTEPVEIGGHQIDENELVVARIGSANRDPSKFDAPNEFRPERNPNPHLTFGGGIHFCLGAQLARLEADIALERLLDRFEVIEPDLSDLSPQSLVYGVDSLPCYVSE